MSDHVIVDATSGETEVREADSEDIQRRRSRGPSPLATAAQDRRDRRVRLRQQAQAATTVDDLKAVVAELLDDGGANGG